MIMYIVILTLANILASYILKHQYKKWNLLPALFKVLLFLGALATILFFDIFQVRFWGADANTWFMIGGSLFPLIFIMSVFSRFRGA